MGVSEEATSPLRPRSSSCSNALRSIDLTRVCEVGSNSFLPN